MKIALDDKLSAYLQMTGSKRNPSFPLFCSMIEQSWLQPGEETRNPWQLHVRMGRVGSTENHPSGQLPNTIITDPRTTILSVSRKPWLKEPHSNLLYV